MSDDWKRTDKEIARRIYIEVSRLKQDHKLPPLLANQPLYSAYYHEWIERGECELDEQTMTWLVNIEDIDRILFPEIPLNTSQAACSLFKNELIVDFV